MKYCRFASPDGPQFGLIETVAGTEQITQTTSGGLLPDFSKAKKISPQPLSAVKLLYPDRALQDRLRRQKLQRARKRARE